MMLTNKDMQDILNEMNKDQVIMRPVAYVKDSYSFYDHPETDVLFMQFGLNYYWTVIPGAWFNIFKTQTTPVDANFSGSNFTFDRNHAIINLVPDPNVGVDLYINQLCMMIDATNIAYRLYIESTLIARKEALNIQAEQVRAAAEYQSKYIPPSNQKNQPQTIDALEGSVNYNNQDVLPDPFHYNYGRNN